VFGALAHKVPHPILALFAVDRYLMALTILLPSGKPASVRAILELRREPRSDWPAARISMDLNE
jgi:hypothetical protein